MKELMMIAALASVMFPAFATQSHVGLPGYKVVVIEARGNDGQQDARDEVREARRVGAVAGVPGHRDLGPGDRLQDPSPADGMHGTSLLDPGQPESVTANQPTNQPTN